MTPPENQIYIRPTLHIHPNLAAAKEFTDTYGAYHSWSDKKSVGISDAALGKRNLIIGEPRVGKTLLLTQIQEHLNSIGFSTCFRGPWRDRAFAPADARRKEESPTRLKLTAWPVYAASLRFHLKETDP
jgi:hypothetical protein